MIKKIGKQQFSFGTIKMVVVIQIAKNKVFCSRYVILKTAIRRLGPLPKACPIVLKFAFCKIYG